MTTFLQNTRALFGLVRDALITLLLLALIFAPAFMNGLLIKAGFTEADLGPFKWQKEVQANNDALTAANGTIADLRGQLQKTTALLAPSAATAALPPADAEKVAQVRQQNKEAVGQTAATTATLAQRIQRNRLILINPKLIAAER